MPALTPRTNTRLFGHEEAYAALLQDFSRGKLAHGWIISGPQGIGKATFCYRFARAILSAELASDIDPLDPLFLRIAAGSHSDMLVIEPVFDTKKEEYAREITVAQAREIAQFLSLTPGEGQWRVVIVDAADALNANGANAILKILEEPPPQVLLFLISHNPGRLLPTIRSRCRNLKLKTLNNRQFISVLDHVAPDIGDEERNILAQLSCLSPGIALELHEQGAIALYNQMIELLLPTPSLDSLKIHAFAEALTAGKAHAHWHLFTRMALCLFERITLQASGMEIEALSHSESQLLQKMSAFHPAVLWAEKWQQIASQFLLAERLHLDYKQFIIVFIHSILSTEEFKIGSAAA